MASLDFLRKKLHEVVASPYSSFYENLYRGRIAISSEFPKDWDDWESLPTISKADLMRVPYQKRTFIPLYELERVQQTSGTTKGGIVIVPRPYFPYQPELRSRFHPKRYIGFMYPHTLYHKYIDEGTVFIGGDPARLEASAALASKLRVDGIAAGTASILIEFAPILARKYDLARVTSLFVQTDVCRDAQRTILGEYFPNAKISMMYNCTEMQSAAIFSAVPPVEGFPSAVEAPMAVHHFDLIDEDGKPIRECGVPGELVVSVLHENMALPLIRYRPGDRAVMHIRTPERVVFTVLGRTSGNPVRLSVGEIKQEEIERALEAIAPGKIQDFEARVKERDGNPPLPYLHLSIVPRDESTRIDARDLAARLAAELHIAERRSYQDGVERGVCGPMEIALDKPLQGAGWKKRQRLVDERTGTI